MNDSRSALAPRLLARWVGLTVFGLFLVGICLRFRALAFQSLWNDELASWYMAHWPTVSQTLRRGVIPDVHPPGYFLILHAWIRLLGDSEWTLRALSAVFGCLAIPAMFQLGRSLYSRREGLIAAALFTVSWLPIYYSQEVRPYALLILSALLSTRCLVEVAQQLASGVKLKRRHLLAYVLSAAVCAYSHYFGALLVALQAIGAFFFFAPKPRLWPRLATIHLAVAATYAPWLPHLAEDLSRESTWVKTPTLESVLTFVRFCFAQSDLVAGAAGVLLVLGLVLGVRQEAAGARGRILVRRLLASPATLLLFWLLAPAVIAYFKSQVSTPVFTARNLVVSTPAIYLLLARAMSRLFTSRTLTAAAVLASLGLLADLTVRQRYYSTKTKEQWREAVAHVVESERRYPDSQVFSAAIEKAHFDYYFIQLGSEQRIRGNYVSAKHFRRIERSIELTSAKHLWYLTGHRRPSKRLLRMLSNRYRLVDHRQYINTSVRLFEVKPRGGP